MKHVGKMKANGAPVAIAFRTLPGDANSCLVVDTGKLEPTQHDSLMSLIESGEAQGAFELGTVLSTRRFPDGSVVLPYLHQTGTLIKVPTKNVIMTSAPQQQVPLDELNKLIAEQKGCSIEDLAITEDGNPRKSTVKPKEDFTKTTSSSVSGDVEEAVTSNVDVLDDKALASKFRSQAAIMLAEAQALQQQADDLDPPAKAKVTKKTTSKKAIA
jgi:hypothetical protein